MSASLSFVQRRGISISSKMFKYATVRKDGCRNKEKEESDKRNPWSKVRYRGKEDELIRARTARTHEWAKSDIGEAKEFAIDRLNRMAQSLKDRGYSREMTPYQPREDVEQVIKSIFDLYFTAEPGSDIELWLSQPLNDSFVKFKFLIECEKQLEHELPSPDLHRMKTVGDVVLFYKTPIRGITTYESLARRQNELPPNLHVMNQYIRFNPENDTFFDGKDAYPAHPMIVTGIKGRKKYEDVKVPFEWPDI